MNLPRFYSESDIIQAKISVALKIVAIAATSLVLISAVGLYLIVKALPAH